MRKLNYIMVAGLILIIPHALQFIFNFNLLIGTESYDNARIATLINEEGLNYSDEIGRTDNLDPYQVLVALISRLVGVELASRLIPFICGILFCYMFMEILERTKIKERTRNYTMFFMLLSPIFIYNFTVSQQYAVVSVLILAAYFMIFFQKYLSVVFFCFACMFAPRVYFVSIIPLFFILWRKDLWLFVIASIFGLAGAIFRIVLGMPAVNTDVDISIIGLMRNHLVLFGAETGFTVFIMILAVIAFIATWHVKKKFLEFYLFMVMFIFSTLYVDPNHSIILNFALVFFAARGYIALLERRWDLKVIRELMIVLVLLGSITSSVFYVDSLSNTSPPIGLVENLKFINERDEQGSVLADPSYHQWIEYFSNRSAHLTPDDSIGRYNDTLTLLSTVDKELAFSIIDEYDIRFIIIDPGLQDYADGIELVLLMEHEDRFELLKDLGDTSVWLVNS